MTAGKTEGPARISRCVSDLSPESSCELDATPPIAFESLNLPENEPEGWRSGCREVSPPVTKVKKRRRSPLRRYVSQELTCDFDKDYQASSSCACCSVEKLGEKVLEDSSSVRNGDKADSHVLVETRLHRISVSPLRRVSELDDVAGASRHRAMDMEEDDLYRKKHAFAFASAMVSSDQEFDDGERSQSEQQVPHLPILLHDSNLLAVHTNALRVEADLFPMRLILSRLMSHPTHNRRGVFNSPVDPVALGLPDYHQIVKNPMDLGTVKARLHAVAYPGREDVASDIRLVFNNAMRYNPKDNSVHEAARILLSNFEVAYQGIQAKPPNCGEESTLKTVEIKGESTSSSVTTWDQNMSQRLHRVVSATTLSPDEVDIAGSDSSSMVSLYPENSMHTTDAPLAPLNSKPAATDESKSDFTNTQASVNGFQEGVRFLDPEKALKSSKASRKRVSLPHTCHSCLGRTCVLCLQGCLQHEPTLLICAGSNCSGSKIRKGAVYYIAKDGSCQFCQRCYSNLSAVLPRSDYANSHENAVRYKRDLLKRKNDEEIVEEWVTCVKCGGGLHHVCAMHNKYIHDDERFVCPSCLSQEQTSLKNELNHDRSFCESHDAYTFRIGSDIPVKLSEVCSNGFQCGEGVLRADSLPETPISSYMQQKVREQMASEDFPHAEDTVSVRLISNCNKFFKVPEVVRRHFRMETSNVQDSADGRNKMREDATPPSTVKYNSKAFALFQKIDGLDVCVFCMYVQEYDGDEKNARNVNASFGSNQKRVYIAYLDSVEYFRPRECRTRVYHEMLVAYLASARARGYETAHIWACPPARGNSFVFWSHPASQRTPTKERLVSWYHGALSRAFNCGVVADVKSLYECSFEKNLSTLRRNSDGNNCSSDFHFQSKLVCPPLLDGDFWIEEAVRIHAVSFARHLKSQASFKTSLTVSSVLVAEPSECENDCPATLIAAFLRDYIMAHPKSAPFRRPVNAAALKLKDYHSIISKPMDLGTIYSRCLLGEFETVRDLVADVELVFANAMLYNPKGHFIHNMAVEMRHIFFTELDRLAGRWTKQKAVAVEESSSPWLAFADLSMSLDMRLTSADKTMSEAAVSLTEVTPSLGEGEKLDSKCSEQAPPEEPSQCCDAPLQQNSPRPSKLLTGGPDAILQSMVGNDVWLMDNKYQSSQKGKKSCGKRKNPSCGNDEKPKRRRQSWLGEEVGESVRRQRTSFFTCYLTPSSEMTTQEEKRVKDYDSYVAPFVHSLQQHKASIGDDGLVPSRITDTRHAFLEFSQFRNFEFDTLRKAKYSTAMLLYHLHSDAPGLVPSCTSCGHQISDVRWHKVKSAVERRVRPVRKGKASPNSGFPASEWKAEELCSQCHSKSPSSDEFIPLQVSFHK